MKTLILAVAVIAIGTIVLSALLIQTNLGHSSVTSNTTSAGYLFSATKAYSATNSNNLNLSFVISTTHLTIGQTINMTASVNNTLASPNNVNNVSATSSYRFAFLVTSQACTADPSPVMTVLFQGYYTIANVSLAQPLYQFPPGESSSCHSMPTSYTFLPSSNLVSESYIGSDQKNHTMNYPLVVTAEFRGYFTTTSSTSISNETTQSQFENFSMGTYTIVSGDMWGDTAFLYFTVS